MSKIQLKKDELVKLNWSEQAECDSDDYRFRRYFSQFLAASVKMMLIFQFGLCISFMGIVNAALSGNSNEYNRNETLKLTGVESSWIGSIIYIGQPIGSIISVITTDYLGRKLGMMVVNIPFAIAWLIMYHANSVWHIFIANSLLGLSFGLTEGPIMTYIGEICEPSTRGMLISYTNLGSSLGGFMVFFLNTQTDWRTDALICMSIPILTFVALIFVPESPHWLISKDRIKRAEKSLKWLRGWVSKDQIAHELQRLQTFVERSKSCDACMQKNQQCLHAAPSFSAKLIEFKRKRTLKPFFIVISLFVILQFSGIFAMTSYLVGIFKAYGSPLPADVTTAILGCLNVFATITFLSLEHFVGKRRIYLIVLTGVCISSLIISAYGFIYLPNGYNSFDKNLSLPELSHPTLVYIPTVCLIVWSFCSYCGVLMMPWQILAEMFAFKTRGLATGLAASINYLMAFGTVKSYFNLETMLSLPGVALFYCIVATFGLVLMFNILPETENRSLEDIERHFADDNKRLCDWQIPQHVKQANNETEIKYLEISRL